MVTSRTVLVRIRADADQFNRQLTTSSGAMRRLGDESDRTAGSLNTVEGRLGALVRSTGALGPALAPVLGVSAQAVAGLSTQLGFAALAAGSAVIAFQGVGDAVKALSKAQLEPTVENLQKAREAMQNLAPEGQSLVRTLVGLRDEWFALRGTAQAGLFPGVEAGLDNLMSRLPDLQKVLYAVSKTAGDLFDEGTASLSSSRWDRLFEYLQTSAQPILTDTAHTVGDLTHALSELIIAMDPLTRDFTAGLAKAADDFDKWATGLSATQCFEDFVAYVRETGPQVVETISSLSDAIASIVEASAPLGGPTLQILKTIADTIGLIADSPLGGPLIQLAQLASVMSLLNTAWTRFSTGTVGTFVAGQRSAVAALGQTITAEQRATMSAQELAAAQQRLATSQSKAYGTLGRSAAGLLGFGAAALDAQHRVTGLGVASGALMGFAVGGPWGAALGAGVGLLGEFAQASGDAAGESDEFTATLDAQTGAITRNSRAWIAKKLEDEGALEVLQKQGIAASDAVDAITEGGDKLAAFQDRLRSTYEQTAPDMAAYAEIGGQIQQLAGTVSAGESSFHRQADAVGELGDAYADGASKAEQFANALAEVNGWLDKRSAYRNYVQSIKDATKAIDKNGEAYGRNGKKARENQAQIDGVISSTIQLISHLKGADRVQTVNQAKKDIRALMEDAGASEGQIAKVMAKLDALNGKKAKPDVDVNTSPAMSGINAVEHRLDMLDGKKATTTVTTVLRTVRSAGDTAGGPPQLRARGGLIRGPGTRTSDSIDLRASDFEYVVQAKAVEHYGPSFFDDLNNMTLAPDQARSFAADRTVHVSGGGNAAVVAELAALRQQVKHQADRLEALHRSLPDRLADANVSAFDYSAAKRARRP